MTTVRFKSTLNLERFKRNLSKDIVRITRENFRDVVRGKVTDKKYARSLLGFLEKALKNDKEEFQRLSDHITGKNRNQEAEADLLEFIDAINFGVSFNDEGN